MARSARQTVSEYVSQREVARFVEKMNRAKSDLRDLVKKWRRTRIELAGLPEGDAYQACADDAPSSYGDERWLDKW